jgi:hypothetical protein
MKINITPVLYIPNADSLKPMQDFSQKILIILSILLNGLNGLTSRLTVDRVKHSISTTS